VVLAYDTGFFLFPQPSLYLFAWNHGIDHHAALPAT
jgi:hypothetical protein